MIEKEVVITLEHGLHARPAAELVKALSRFQSDVTIYANGKQYQAKSILSMMSAAVKKGESVRVVVNGEDEHDTWTFLQNYL